MTQLGKVLKGLKCCGAYQYFAIDWSRCVECPYCEINNDQITGGRLMITCHHKDLMQDTLNILTKYVKNDINQKKQLKDHQDWIDSWSNDCYT